MVKRKSMRKERGKERKEECNLEMKQLKYRFAKKNSLKS